MEGEREVTAPFVLSIVKFVQGEVIPCNRAALTIAPHPPNTTAAAAAAAAAAAGGAAAAAAVAPPLPPVPAHPPLLAADGSLVPPLPLPAAPASPPRLHPPSLPPCLPPSFFLERIFNEGREPNALHVTWEGPAFGYRR